jgi:ribosomal protein L11 methyltransferase
MIIFAENFHQMNYLQISLLITPAEEYLADLLAAALGEVGFDSFASSACGMEAYIKEELFSEEKLIKIISDFPYQASIEYKIAKTENKDWNEEWEKNYFKPIVIGDKCVIHSSFHTDYPTLEYEIVIDPKMAFGTGHHETTSLMLEYILAADLRGKRILDMGCGTAALAILASMRGAKNGLAVDIDNFCILNSHENLAANNIANIEVREGGAEQLNGESFDCIFANINRNILLQDIGSYAACLSPGGELFMSGFYTEDIPAIEAEIQKFGLRLLDCKSKNNWAAIRNVKSTS